MQRSGLSALLRNLLMGALLGTIPTAAQAPPPEVEAEAALAPVTLDGHELFQIGKFGSLPAARRAAGIGERIAEAASDSSVDPREIQLIELEGSVMIQAGHRRIMLVNQSDANQAGVSPRMLAGIGKEKIAAAIVNYRQERQGRALLRSAALALAGTLVFLTLLWLLRRLFQYFESNLTRLWNSKVAQLKHQAFQVVQVERIYSASLSALRLLRTMVWLTLGILYLQYVLGLFPWTRSVSVRLLSLILQPLESMGRSLLDSLPDIGFLLVLTLVVRFVLKVANALFDGIEHGSITLRNFEPEWAQPTFRIVRVLILAFALVVAYPYLPGSDSEAFKGISIFLGVVFSLGSSSALANIIAGYSLTYRRAFRIGDRIRIGDEVGDVSEVRLQVTHLRSLKNEEIIIPNSNILNSNVINYSRLARERGLILHTKVGIGYETPWRQVEAMLLEAAARTGGLMRQPPPFVLQRELGDFAVTYELNAYCDNPQVQLALYSEMHKNILDVFNEYGVQIMTPAYEGDPEEAKLVPRSKWFEAPARPPADGVEPA